MVHAYDTPADRMGIDAARSVLRVNNVDAIDFPRHIGDPRILPELRHALMQFAVPGGVWEASEVANQVRLFTDHGTLSPPAVNELGQWVEPWAGGASPDVSMEQVMQSGRTTVEWYRRQLPGVQLVHVTDEMTDVVEAASVSVPADHTLTVTDLPWPSGLVVYARPLEGVAMEGTPMQVFAHMWGPVRLPLWEQGGVTEALDAVTIATFQLLDPITMPDHHWFGRIPVEDRRPCWLPMGRSDWPFGEAVESDLLNNLDISGRASIYEDRRMMVSLWTILSQPRITELRDVQAPRHVRRRLERAGNRTPSGVTVVHLRRPEYRPQPDPDAEPGRRVSVRFMVRPFWRRQACGPNWSEHKLVLVPPHWRGPADAPVQHTERVWELDR